MDEEFVNAFITFDKVKAGFEKANRKASKVAAYWASEGDRQLGAQYKCQIAYLLARVRGRTTPGEFTRDVVKLQAMDLSSAPRRRRGVVRGPDLYTSETYANWLNGTNPPAPEGSDLEVCVDLILRAAEQALSKSLRPNASLHALLIDYRGTAREAFSDALALLEGMRDARDWRRIKSRVFGVMPTPNAARRGLASEAFEEHYDAVRQALARRQSVRVTGPHYSGKNELLRKLVREHTEIGFEIENGSLLSLCALSLHELAPTEAINNVASFYRSALRAPTPAESIPDLVSEIGHYARHFPALIVISGVDAIDRDEIVRALHQDQLGEMVSRILQGHPDGRLLVSASSEERSPRRRPVDANEDDRFLAFDESIDLTHSAIAATNYEYHAVRECAKALGGIERGQHRKNLLEDVQRICFDDAHLRRSAISVDTTEELAKFISSALLSEAERFCLGLVGLSHDGLKPATLRAIVDILRSNLEPGLVNFDPVEILDRLPDVVVRKPARESDPGPSCYQLERALRDALLTNWRIEAPDAFRKACWGTARAAASEARSLRLHSGPGVSAGRDVQVLLFLLASVDPSEGGKAPRDRASEHIVLPALQKSEARMPPGPQIVRFAYSTLFEQDLARSAESGVQIFDARLRLAAVFPFLDNSWPWQTYAATEPKPTDWRPHEKNSPWLQLDLSAQLRLLAFATGAAARLGLRPIVSACARQAWLSTEENGRLIALTDRQFAILSRIRRYELDFGILLARNPDARVRRGEMPLTEPSGLAAVEARIETLIDGIPDRDSKAGRRELRLLSARHAEVLHLRGRQVEALVKFRMSSRIDAADEMESGVEAGTLSGRSRRMYTRLLIELARGRLSEAVVQKAARSEGNKLIVPMFDRIVRRPRLLNKAERVVEESLRSLSRGTLNDWIGTKIDHARLAAVRLNYGGALDLLDEARNLVGASGASRDVLLEYLSVRGRTLADAAAFALGAVAKWPEAPGPKEEELDRLAAWLRLDLETHGKDRLRASAISEALSARALETLAILKSLVLLPETGETRYAIYADYLEVWMVVIRSGESISSTDAAPGRAAARAQLSDAARKLETVLGKMVRTGYLLSHREARLLAEAFRGAGIDVDIPDDLPGISPTGVPAEK